MEVKHDDKVFKVVIGSDKLPSKDTPNVFIIVPKLFYPGLKLNFYRMGGLVNEVSQT